jgi:hypothetical protein
VHSSKLNERDPTFHTCTINRIRFYTAQWNRCYGIFKWRAGIYSEITHRINTDRSAAWSYCFQHVEKQVPSTTISDSHSGNYESCLLRHNAVFFYIWTNVSEERITSIFGVENPPSINHRLLLANGNWAPSPSSYPLDAMWLVFGLTAYSA